MARCSLMIALLCAACLLFVQPSAAQTPSITGIGMADGSSPLRNGYYWSIYGSNLSSGSGSNVYFRAYAAQLPPNDWNQITLTYQYNSGNETGGWWYESSSQVNFKPQAANSPPWYLTGGGTVQVCRSSGTCSSQVSVSFI